MIDARARVLHDLDRRTDWQSLLDLLHPLDQPIGDVGRAVPLRFLDVDANRFAAVIQRERPRLDRSVLDLGNLPKANQLTVALGHDQMSELFRVYETALEPD